VPNVNRLARYFIFGSYLVPLEELCVIQPAALLRLTRTSKLFTQSSITSETPVSRKNKTSVVGSLIIGSDNTVIVVDECYYC